MKHTEEEILEKAKKVMSNVRGKFYREANIQGAFFEEEKSILSGIHRDKKMPIWTVSISALFENIDFLHISDETGEPVYYQNFNTLTFDVDKNEDGYYLVGVEE